MAKIQKQDTIDLELELARLDEDGSSSSGGGGGGEYVDDDELDYNVDRYVEEIEGRVIAELDSILGDIDDDNINNTDEQQHNNMEAYRDEFWGDEFWNENDIRMQSGAANTGRGRLGIRFPLLIAAFIVMILVVVGIPRSNNKITPSPNTETGVINSDTNFTLESSAFDNEGEFPAKYAQSGKDDDEGGYLDLSPPLSWANAPLGTKSFVLIMEDLDAKGPHWRVQWLVWNMPSTLTSLAEGDSRIGGLGEGGGEEGIARVGANDYGNPYYDGPIKFYNHTTDETQQRQRIRHSYHFRIIAVGGEDDGYIALRDEEQSLEGYQLKLAIHKHVMKQGHLGEAVLRFKF